MIWAIALIALFGLGVAACGDDGANGSPPPAQQSGAAVSLSLRVSDGEGNTRRARIVCRSGGGSELSGYMRGESARAVCRTARSLARFLDSTPDPERICTFVYGGPQTGRIRGRIGARSVDRRFARRDGCEIADWKRVDALLAPGLR